MSLCVWTRKNKNFAIFASMRKKVDLIIEKYNLLLLISTREEKPLPFFSFLLFLSLLLLVNSLAQLNSKADLFSNNQLNLGEVGCCEGKELRENGQI